MACALLSMLLCVQCGKASDQFDGSRAFTHVVKQDEFGPRPVGSEAGRKTAEYIATELEQLGWTTEMQEFTYRGVPGVNVVAAKGAGPLILLGAHYDTRLVADRDPVDRTQPVPGANDGGSGVAVLLELARVLNLDKAGAEVWLAFFDAEDQGNIDGWPFSVGAAEMAQHLSAEPQAVVIVDMVGDAKQEIYFERNSDARLMRVLWSIATELGYEEHFIAQYQHSIIDDHLPFAQRGIPAVDIIDFDYPYWHTAEDTPDKVRPESLERVGRVLETWLEERLLAEAD
jgi:glutaminyl-peptide cyclotransferase